MNAPDERPSPGGEVDDRVARLRERADRDFPQSWVPDNPGDEIAGELVRYERGTTPYGEKVIAVLQPPEGPERSVWLIHAVLHDEFARSRPKPGEFLLIRYLGRKQPDGAGAAYQAYRLEIDREESVAPDWDALAADAPAPSSDVPVDRQSNVHEPLEGRGDDLPF